MKVSEQIALLTSGKVTWEQLKELKAEELVEKNEPPQEKETETKETETETKETETKKNPVNDKALQDALSQVEALTKQVEELQKKNTQKDIEGKAGGEAFDMSEFVKNFKG